MPIFTEIKNTLERPEKTLEHQMFEVQTARKDPSKNTGEAIEKFVRRGFDFNVNGGIAGDATAMGELITYLKHSPGQEQAYGAIGAINQRSKIREVTAARPAGRLDNLQAAGLAALEGRADSLKNIYDL
jgi:hypothetical protein